ncbi:7-carboxy-7-deazaguanine synthase QueE [Archaeoglobus veneficus]|uniref:7-carboxy-7-deazaguanine synthase n=1 Tax=Archaeoglobus veneficus (strain DSM 11195 / SNP6) TaxID=693661 RepID=F2KSR8_ARCVS|nr:7-carboxy-7-deazaguanine synthase QueE [Archaeoglobus veneficus]AEA46963.1 Radical SAM domain protein [Archaeoglobus veneficus SNP6]
MCSQAESIQGFAEIREIFESIQGEGILVGVRQLFVRFARCNLNCIYCDTPTDSTDCTNHITGEKLPNPVSREYVSEFFDRNVHSICLTGGEPLLYADFIASLPKTRPFYLETNMSLPEMAKKLTHVDFVAGDFKVREAIVDGYEELVENTVRCFRILRNREDRLTFCKFVLPERFDAEEVINNAISVENYVECFILQPVFGTSKRGIETILELQKVLMEKVCVDVRVIPQVHKYLGVM